MVRNQNQIYELESLRGLAAWLVVFFHIPKWNPILNVGLVNNGYLMVDFFFVLSGFVIFNAYGTKINSKSDLIRFQFLRFARLYPVHLLFLLVFLVFECAKYLAQINLGLLSVNSQPFQENNFIALLQQVFLIHSLGPTGHSVSFNSPAWSISVEFYTYLFFGLSMIFIQKTRAFFFLAMSLGSLALLATSWAAGFDEILRCWSGFFIGCLTAHFVSRVQIHLPSYFSFLIFVGLVLFLHFKPEKQFDALIYFFSALLILGLVLSQQGLFNKWLTSALFVGLGSISYAVYMSHSAVLWGVSQCLRILWGKPQILVKGQMIPQLGPVETLLVTFIFIAIVFLISLLVYNCIERPLREKSRRMVFSFSLKS